MLPAAILTFSPKVNVTSKASSEVTLSPAGPLAVTVIVVASVTAAAVTAVAVLAAASASV